MKMVLGLGKKGYFLKGTFTVENICKCLKFHCAKYTVWTFKPTIVH